jgi:hypothetical protein
MKGHRKHREDGGKIEKGTVEPDSPVKEAYSGKGSHVEHEAEERKHGGRAKRKHGGKIEHHNAMHSEHHHEHPKAAHRPKRKRGGHVMHEHDVKGEHAKHRHDRKARKSGGKMGADKAPLSSAAKGMEPKGHKSQVSW